MAVLALMVSLLAGLGPAQGVERAATRPAGTTTLLAVQPGRAVWLRSAPGGARLARVVAATEFGSPTVLAVLGVRGAWVRVSSPAVANASAWVRVGPALRRGSTRYSVRVDLSARRATVRRAGRLVRRVAVAIGAPSSPTPTGTFQITDRLPGERFSPVYGCCILALSGRQPHPPPGWSGGDRLALHGTPDGLPAAGWSPPAACARVSRIHNRIVWYGPGRWRPPSCP